MNNGIANQLLGTMSEEAPITTRRREVIADLTAEHRVIGACLLNVDVISEIEQVVAVTDFHQSTARRIMRAIYALNTRGDLIEPETIAAEMERDGHAEAGVVALMQAAASECAAASTGVEYARRVAEKSRLRRLVRVGEEISEAARRADAISGDVANSASQRIFELCQTREGAKGMVHVSESTGPLLEEIRLRRANPHPVVGQPTGLIDYDMLVGGLRPGKLTVWAARPAQGKTALALQAAMNIATGGVFNGRERFVPQTVAMFSLEMTKQELLIRALAQVSQIAASKIETGALTDDEMSRVEGAQRVLDSSRLYVDETPGLTSAAMLPILRRLHAQAGGVGLIVADYLGLIGSTNKSEARTYQIADTLNDLCGYAKTFQCPFLLLVQAGRDLEKRADGAPVLADLADSKAIEASAYTIGFLHRPNNTDRSRTCLYIEKNRGGRCGTIDLHFHGETQRFTCAAKGYHENHEQNHWRSDAEF